MKEEIFKALWEKTETAYKKGTSESITVLTEDKFDEFIEDLVKICNISDVMQQRELLVAFLEILENTPKVKIPLNVGMISVDEYLAANSA